MIDVAVSDTKKPHTFMRFFFIAEKEENLSQTQSQWRLFQEYRDCKVIHIMLFWRPASHCSIAENAPSPENQITIPSHYHHV